MPKFGGREAFVRAARKREQKSFQMAYPSFDLSGVVYDDNIHPGIFDDTSRFIRGLKQQGFFLQLVDDLDANYDSDDGSDSDDEITHREMHRRRGRGESRRQQNYHVHYHTHGADNNNAISPPLPLCQQSGYTDAPAMLLGLSLPRRNGGLALEAPTPVPNASNLNWPSPHQSSHIIPRRIFPAGFNYQRMVDGRI
ncbi:predicted protein [Uncinocarpus reesii 1704]|uniref:Uncharacterized protein n=1 Tax=Uncinocarpus reesii (strain UAMH 1704) TaxID=336963 RepID=C4JX37_UNCRE|nr:uncharacterized protein UREG_06210 [Uncinocarpus reesii 1704]EEP81345.1 predicted protein [Uncinocarpus reesii 1704]